MADAVVNIETMLPKITRMKLVSAPALAKELEIQLPEAQQVLEELSKRDFVRLTEQGGLVPVYKVTKEGYFAVESLRERPLRVTPSIFGRIFRGLKGDQG